jgi:ribonuclease HII
MLVLGIDDAGRGPVIGPMVLAGVLMDEKTERELKKLGVKDSKQLTQRRREFFAEKIKAAVETFEIVLAHPEEIDGKNYKGINLNALEALKTAEIINKINKGFNKIKVIVDCPSVSIEKWKDFLKTKIHNLSNLEVVCEHKADVNHVSVSAASILAKCTREIEMGKLKEKYGDEIGSGYCSDSLTVRFLEKHAQRYGDKGIFRKTWSTWKELSAISAQQKLLG